MKLKKIKDYYSNGNLDQHYFVDENGLKQGEYSDYHRIGGNRWVICNYKDGKKHGKYRSWYVNGNKNVVSYYKNGLRHGNTNLWYLAGQLCTIINYRNNNTFGISIEYKKLLRQ